MSLVFGAGAIHLRIDASVERMLLHDHPERVYYQTFLERYGSDELVIICFQAPRLFSAPALALIQRISTALSEISLNTEDGGSPVQLIDQVVSLCNAPWISSRVSETGERELIIGAFADKIPSTAAERHELWRLAVEDPLYVGNLLSKPKEDSPDAPLTTFIIGRLVYRDGDLEYRQFVQTKVDEILERERGQAEVDIFHVAGVPSLKAALSRAAQLDIFRVVPASRALIFGLLFVIFRTAPAILLPLATVSIASIWTLGLLTLNGSCLNIISSVILALVEVTSYATTTHLLSYYYDNCGAFHQGAPLIRRTLHTMAWPTFLASFTTAIGFASLSVSKIVPIQEVGLYSAFGVLSAWLIATILIPSVFSFLPIPPPGKRSGGRAIAWFVSVLPDFVDRYRWPLLIGGLLLIGVAANGVTRVRAETDLLSFLSRDHPIRKSDRFIGQEMGGIHPFDVVVTTAPGELLEPALFERIERLQAWMENQPHVSRTLSVVDYVKRINQEIHDGNASRFEVPGSRREIATALLLLENGLDLSSFIYPDWESAEEARISIRLDSVSTTDVTSLIQRTNQYLATNVVSDPSFMFHPDELYPPVTGIRAVDTVYHDLFNAVQSVLSRGSRKEPFSQTLEPGQVSARVTGIGVLYAVMVDSLVNGQISSLAVAFLIIWITVTVLLRSAWAGTLAMIPNLFPILLLFGIMGLADISLNVGTAMISAICMGIAVDDTIFFLMSYRSHLARLGSERRALQATFGEVGKPIVITSVVLAAGFSCLSLSAFGPHVDFGLLAAVTMLLALLGDLLLLPAILLIFKPALGRPATRRQAK